MSRAKVHIPKEELEELYIGKRLTPAAIAPLYGCNSITIRNRIIEYGIPLRTKSAAQTRYFRKDFTGSDIVKAYMLGFRYGDLNVYMPFGKSETIVVRSHTTLAAQEEVFKNLFNNYGKITTSRNTQTIQSTCYLNKSFSFLMGKYPQSLRSWIRAEETRMWAFIAGYIDAEGTFGLNQGRGRFKIDAYDYLILSDIFKFLHTKGIRVLFRKIAQKGRNDYGWIWKQDLWRLSVNEARSLSLLIRSLQPYLLHRKRRADARTVARNIASRIRHGTVT